CSNPSRIVSHILVSSNIAHFLADSVQGERTGLVRKAGRRPGRRLVEDARFWVKTRVPALTRSPRDFIIGWCRASI
ncbi:MAG TPA: hypothetical protein VEH84_13545, partial [Alphaproteobacteria bacterium]|nr:hypothetical protein [Alphaproteobacteria bacterium]